MYSQNNEEQYILEYFSGITEGICIDIGAYTGKELSNTRALLLKGWSGIMVEPSPFVFTALLKNCVGLKTICLQTAVVPKKSDQALIRFYDSEGDAISTTLHADTNDHFKKWGREPFKYEFYTAAIGPDQLAYYTGAFTGPIRFINIDVEGMNVQLFLEMLNYYSPDLWCVEHDGKADVIKAAAANRGYTKTILYNGENIILGK